MMREMALPTIEEEWAGTDPDDKDSKPEGKPFFTAEKKP
jgi:hypothetical protein